MHFLLSGVDPCHWNSCEWWNQTTTSIGKRMIATRLRFCCTMGLKKKRFHVNLEFPTEEWLLGLCTAPGFSFHSGQSSIRWSTCFLAILKVSFCTFFSLLVIITGRSRFVRFFPPDFPIFKGIYTCIST